MLEVQLPWLDKIIAANDKRRLPVVLTTLEVRSLLDELTSTMGRVASLLYGTGMQLLEGLRLRIKDVEFERREIIVREGKGGKDRVTVLPKYAPWRARHAALASSSPAHRMCRITPSPRTCCRRATTSARCRNWM